VICKACNHIRDVDLCRDSHLLSNGKQQYVVDSVFTALLTVHISFVLKHLVFYYVPCMLVKL